MIAKLQKLNDPLIGKFNDGDLLLIISECGYHSPEDSEEDEDGGDNKIVVRNLQWRSSTVSEFIAIYIKLACINSF